MASFRNFRNLTLHLIYRRFPSTQNGNEVPLSYHRATMVIGSDDILPPEGGERGRPQGRRGHSSVQLCFQHNAADGFARTT